MDKTIKIVLGIAAIVVVGALVTYFLTRSKSTSVTNPVYQQATTQSPVGSISTADWKVYENKELGISFQHPQDWEVSFQEPSASEKFSKNMIGKEIIIQPVNATEAEELAIQIQVWDNRNNLSAKEYFDGDPGPEYPQENRSVSQYNRTNSATVGGIIKYTDYRQQVSESYAFVKDTNRLIQIVNIYPAFPIIDQTFDHILLTLKLTT